MKTEREILSLGPCKVFILQKIIQKRTKNTSYLNVNKTKKDIGRFKENNNGKKFYIGRRFLGSLASQHCDFSVKRKFKNFSNIIIILYRYLSEISKFSVSRRYP